MLKDKQGFTIVELLIVIVVIGILAAITIVAYNGIQAKARNTQLLSAMDTYEKALRQHKILNGHYPRIENSGQVRTCLGDYPDLPLMAKSVCYQIGNKETPLFQLDRQQIIDDQLGTILGRHPSVPQTIVKMPIGDNTLYLRGITYMPSYDISAAKDHGQTADLTYYIDGDQTCGRGVKATGLMDGVLLTNCIVNLD